MLRYILGHDGDRRALGRRLTELLDGRTVLPGTGHAVVGTVAKIRIVALQQIVAFEGVVVDPEAVVDGRRAFVIEPHFDEATRAKLSTLLQQLRNEAGIARAPLGISTENDSDDSPDERVPNDFAELGEGTLPRLRPTAADEKTGLRRSEPSIGSYRSLIKLDGADVSGVRRPVSPADRQARRARTYFDAAVDELGMGNLRNARVFASLAVEHQPGEPTFVQLLQQIEARLRA
jgi:hypothetical protein